MRRVRDLLLPLILAVASAQAFATCQTQIVITGQMDQSNDTIFTCINNPLQFEDQSILGGILSVRSWDFGDGSNPVDGLLSSNTSYMYSVAGTYTMTMTVGSAQCPTMIETRVVVVLGVPDYTVSHSDASCAGICDGEATVSLVGPNQSYYNVVWNDPGTQQTATALDLCAGTYFAVISDSYGCSDLATSPVTVNEPAPFTVSVNSIVHLNCNGTSNGSVSLNPSNGSGPYTFDIGDGPQNNGSFTGLSGGSYTAVATNGAGCEATVAFTINEPSAIIATLDATTDVDCNGNATGSASISASGGTSPYTYNIGNGAQAIGTFNGLMAGSYAVQVRDGNNCSTSVDVTIDQPDELLVSFNAGSLINLCPSNGDTSLEVSISGGTAPFNSSWSSSPDLNVAGVTMAVLTPTESSVDMNYAVQVVDQNGCQTSDTIWVNATSSSLNGAVSIGSFPCIECQVFMYHHSSTSVGAWHAIDSVMTDPVGHYDFGQVNNFEPFVLMADPNDQYYPMSVETFYPAEYDWNNATVFDMCGNDYTKNIAMIEPMVFNGTNTISGTVWVETPGKAETEEDPIPLIDVVVEKTPPGSAQGRIATDENGNYRFMYVPDSDTAYSIFVNIPGVPVTNTYEVLANDGGEAFVHLDFCINLDWTEINTCQVDQGLAAESVESDDTGLLVYPNPNNGMFTINTGIFATSDSEISIVDPSGREVFRKRYAQTPYMINMVNVAEGYYMVRIMNGNDADVSPISVIRY